MPDTIIGLITYPFPIVVYISCQTTGTVPAATSADFLSIVGVHRGHIGKAGWNLDQSLVDHHCYRVEVAGMGFQSQTLGLQGNAATPSKGVE